MDKEVSDFLNSLESEKKRRKDQKKKKYKDFKVPFAWDENDQLVWVDEADKSIQYKCNCGSDVKLRGGEKVSRHFYHLTESKCSLESSIHKAYKSVFQECKKIKLPHKVSGKSELIFDSVVLEKKIGGFIADAIGYINNNPVVIEFAKTSFIGERKLQKIRKANLFCIEVTIDKSITSKQDIIQRIASDYYNKEVIHMPEYEVIRKIKKEYNEKINELKDNFTHENLRLKAKINQLESKIKDADFNYDDNKWRSRIPDTRLYFKGYTKNGNKYYKYRGKGVELIAFVDDKTIFLKSEDRFLDKYRFV